MSQITDRVVEDLRSIVAGERAERGIQQSDLRSWAEELRCCEVQVLDRIALYLAQEYHHERLDFNFCDVVINNLWGWSITHYKSISDELTQVYLAFDEGEFRHVGDTPDADPAEKYTRRYIAEIIERFGDR
ncbi:hypothetical protein [Lichenicoccus roseus]|uniref:Uncharacterized protein n=1 Tax=Lichenicoccus roseus TaxID=2683649 RepID=A0A5R9J1P3_9PROT|nr:hypothetical protein [Lichenicoccus roseus]TLU71554.1 hypothetical protein FE263_16905 [Lichenicoccus roseus]